MSPGTRARIAGLALAIAGAIGVVHGSHVPLAIAADDAAVLRVAFGARPERIEVCRQLTDAEQEALPAHMRQAASCSGTTARYHLEVQRDGVLLSLAELHGGGMRSDRQLYVFREIPIPVGPSEIVVRLTRLDSATAPDSTSLSDEASVRRHAGEVPARLEVRERVVLRPRQVLLITYDAERRVLRALTESP